MHLSLFVGIDCKSPMYSEARAINASFLGYFESF